MYIKRNIKWRVIIPFAWPNLLFFTIYGSIIIFFHHELMHIGLGLEIPFSPLSTIGIATAFYLSFKNNQSYDRLWEARKIWGGIINYSRTWGNHMLSAIGIHTATETPEGQEIANIQKELIYRHLAWTNALRLQLRAPTDFSIKYAKKAIKVFYYGKPTEADWEKDVYPFLSSQQEATFIKNRKNSATQIIRLQGDRLKELLQKGHIDDLKYMEMMRLLEEFYNLQGKCERIKKTPLPRQYSYFSNVFVWIFILLLPFGLIGEFIKLGHNLVWLTLPFYILIAWIFIVMEIVGDISEDPFENFITDIPLTALCRTIEIDLRDMLGETDLPPNIKGKDNVLM